MHSVPMEMERYDESSSNSNCTDSDENFREDEEDDEGFSDGSSSSSHSHRKSQNVAALLRGNLVVRRQPLLPRVLSVSNGAAIARKPFKSPCENGYRDQNEELTRRLWARKRFVPWGSSRAALVAITNCLKIPHAVEKDNSVEDRSLPPGVEPLVLWQPDESDEDGGHLVPIVVDPLLVCFLRPHQREGVQFMFECVSGLCKAVGIAGCILADDMGLGKTLQSITLLYTLLHQGFDGKPMVKRAIIVTPTSLVSNWESEIKKWLGGRVHPIAFCETSRADVVSGIDSFLAPCSPFQILIISYETFRMHSTKFDKSGSCDLLICDEAHRLKNDQTLTNQAGVHCSNLDKLTKVALNQALASLQCSRRVLLSGTPMQNDLEEFFAMVNFTNPGVLGDASYFRRYYEAPIITGREPTATVEERKLGLERSAELSAKVNQFILRRTNALLSNHLPPKIVEVVCCKLTPLQSELYNHFMKSKNVKQMIVEETKQAKILAYITALKKLCNHPKRCFFNLSIQLFGMEEETKWYIVINCDLSLRALQAKLIYDTIRSGSSGTSGLEDCLRFFPPELFSGRSGNWTGGDGIWVELSGKMHVLARLLANLRHNTSDRIVLVSNYTQTLDLFAQLCRERRYPFLRLDGTTSTGKRQKLVNRFNDPSKDEFVFLLSSKAGGCGLNLIGGNRLVLFDPDWNPANDKQAAARVWRDGQKKRVYIYRFLSTGTIEEKVYQRQMSKEGLQKVIQQEQMDSLIPQMNFLSTEDLRDLFTLHENIRSEIHENLNCIRCKVDALRIDDRLEDLTEVDHGRNSTEGCMDQESSDIGGFAENAGCLSKLKNSARQIGTPLEEDLGSWGHHFLPASVPDAILQASAGDEVTFVFTNQVDGKLIPVESTERPKTRGLVDAAEGLSSEEKSQQRQKPVLPSHKLFKRPPLSQMTPLATSDEGSIKCRSSPLGSCKLPRTSLKGIAGTHSRKPNLSQRNQLPLKRLSPRAINEPDDDFV